MRVWDLPTRLFHWLLVAGVATAFVTLGSDRHLDVHVFAGYVVGGLLLFRIAWGLVGTEYARFARFAFGRRAVAAHLSALVRLEPPASVGHNPAGGWAVFGLLALLLVVSLTGVLVLGGEEGQGPFAGWLGIAAGIRLHAVHEIAAWTLLGGVVVHLLGVAVEGWLTGERLVWAMVTGRKREPRGADVPARGAVAAALLLFTLGFGAYSFKGWLLQDPTHPYIPFPGPELADNPVWRAECGSCHIAYHPSLLPARSWRALLDGQHDHFGEDLALGQAVIAQLRDFHAAHAAESGVTEAAWRIAHSIPAQRTVLRITETAYWQQKHDGLAPAVWKDPRVNGEGNCGACHRDAEAGAFQDGAMRVPTDGGGPFPTGADR